MPDMPDLTADVTNAEGQPIVDRERPEYDAEVLKAAFPEMARLDFAQRDDGLVVCRLVLRDLETIKEVDIGFELPADTDTLINAIGDFLNATVDADALAAAEDALDIE